MNLVINVELLDDLIILAPTGRLDTDTSTLLEDRVREGVESEKDVMMIEMNGVDYVSSFGLRVILGAAKKFSAKGGKLILCGLQKDVLNVFRISGFLKILTVADTREAALESLSGA